MSAHSPAASGRHLLADLHGVQAGVLRDPVRIETILTAAAHAAGAHVLSAHFHHFGGQAGVTGVVVLGESHLSIHTWPEHGFAALDVFMCGDARPELALEYVKTGLSPQHVALTSIERGARTALPA
ncbi:S-adenosylmethionine decarboxylase proenzyme precursor [Bordetella ansorpii]|uniref:S-adenosylmethionine decarboxylase proenzyme n=1 Tax=Bordetella ansorpii TaxID=288768 RepID=A0A157M742_9BORD|nr:adenosylmethionine decarboxylase [Bordetella ansorpii]SAI04620.1 S-adenosylmethionine decarboxylase proenzyme precursor [Bordetella ansorpii]